MLVNFFDCRGLVNSYICPPKTQISKEYYKFVLEGLLDHIWWKWPELLRWWILHQDNAWLHMGALLREYLECHNNEVMKRSLYLCDFWLFPSLICELCGQKFETDAQVIRESQTIFEHIPKKFKTTIKKWVGRMEACLAANRRYLERNC